MTISFNLPENIRNGEECALSVLFQEVRTRGTDKFYCQVLVSEVYAELDVNATFDFSSWEEMTKVFPTMLDFLHEVSCNEYWKSTWRENDRIYFFESISGHEGLYEIEDVVWFDAQEEMEEN